MRVGLLPWLMLTGTVRATPAAAGPDEEVWDVTDEPLEPFEVTATFDYHSAWNELPVPRGTTYEDYYGRGPSLLHGPDRSTAPH